MAPGPLAVNDAGAAPALDLAIDHRSPDGFHLQLSTQVPLTGVTALFGPSGSGKSTVLDTIAGLRRDLRTASVILDGEAWQNGDQWQPPWQRAVGYVTQRAQLFPHLDVAGNLAYAERRARATGIGRADVVRWLGLTDLLERSPATLSGGEQQRVAIARALLCQPRLLLLDEPLANLDRAAAGAILAALAGIRHSTKLPMLYVSHQIEEVHAIADRVLIIEAGQLVAEGRLVDLACRLDSRLTADEQAAAILEVEAADRDRYGDQDDYGLQCVQADGQALWIAAGRRPERLRIPARDVSVCRERPRATSILNILEVTIDDLRPIGAAHYLLSLRLDRQRLLARITRRSRDELDLNPGDRLYAQVKSTALLTERHDP
jgi:molybdate transport system ATP-binding protein